MHRAHVRGDGIAMRFPARELTARISAIVAGEVAAGSWPECTRADVRAEVRGRLARMHAAGFVAEEPAARVAVQVELFGGLT